MNWKSMVIREPELAHLERSCRAARQQGAGWHDFWSEHHVQLGRLVGPIARSPVLRPDKAYRIARTHLLQVWIDAMAEPVALPWDSRPLFVEPIADGGASPRSRVLSRGEGA